MFLFWSYGYDHVLNVIALVAATGVRHAPLVIEHLHFGFAVLLVTQRAHPFDNRVGKTCDFAWQTLFRFVKFGFNQIGKCFYGGRSTFTVGTDDDRITFGSAQHHQPHD